MFIEITVHCFAANEKNTSPPQDLSPWLKPRELSNFQNLLQHSPFSLATAEESSPLSERYAITGVITLGGEDQIFVFDRNDQSRELLTKKPNAKSMALINIIHDTDPNKLKATVRIGSESGVITSIEPSTNNPTGPQHFGGPGGPPRNMLHPGMHPGQGYPVPNYPGQGYPIPNYPGQNQTHFSNPPGVPPNFNPNNPTSFNPNKFNPYSISPNSPINPSDPNRRIIRRPVISGPQPNNNNSTPSHFSAPLTQ